MRFKVKHELMINEVQSVLKSDSGGIASQAMATLT